MNTQSQRSTKEQEIDAFARWFGVLLMNLRQHNLKLERQPRAYPAYAKSPAHDKIMHIKPLRLR